MLLINESVEYDSKLYEEYKLNLNWIALHYEDLLLRYENMYVAVNDKVVIDSDSELQTILKRLESNKECAWNTLVVLHILRERTSF
ncbi:MAG TPA: hypothetical protein VJR94_12865 [Candidatus Nitrosocosmicus sp.]|nr:hypothetical protein [Candidatus Nitrosocosmicus sp.]